jgi:hypothetical protein
MEGETENGARARTQDVTLDGHKITFERSEDGALFRILVDRVPIPMTLRETETMQGNGSPRTKEVKARHAARWIATRDCPPTEEGRLYLNPYRAQPRTAYFQVKLPDSAYFYREIWQHHEATMVFTSDFGRVNVCWDYHVDDSN